MWQAWRCDSSSAEVGNGAEREGGRGWLRQKEPRRSRGQGVNIHTDADAAGADGFPEPGRSTVMCVANRRIV